MNSVDDKSMRLHKFLGEPQLHFCLNMSSQLPNARVLTCWNLLCQKLQMLLVVEKVSRQLQKPWEDKPVGRVETFLQTRLFDHVELFSVPSFCDSFWKSRRRKSQKLMMSCRPTNKTFSDYFTRWKLHRVWISNGSEFLLWFETDLLDFEIAIGQGFGLP